MERKYAKSKRKAPATSRKYKRARRVTVPRKAILPFSRTPRLFGFPRMMTVPLKTCRSFSLTGGALTENHYFKINSAYDPMGDFGGDQSTYYDQLTGIYGKCFVTHFSFRIIMTSSQATPYRITSYPSSVAAVIASYTAALGLPGSRITEHVASSIATVPQVHANSVDIQKFLMKPNLDDSDSHAYNADPSTLQYMHVIWNCSANLGATAVVHTRQIVRFYDLRPAVDA